MERAWLSILFLCALLGLGLVDAEGRVNLRESSPSSSAPSVADTTSLAMSEVPVEAERSTGSDAGSHGDESGEVRTQEIDAQVVDQIVARFAVRHTALPERERIALAHTIVREARAHGLSPDLVMGVIEVESAGYHLAVSHVGALGLMQLLPSTAEEVAGKLAIEWQGPDTLFDPTTNVRLGTAYLRELADRYDGNVNIALAAYNWGPGRIDRRIRRGKTLPSLYIQQVMSAVDRYADNTPASTRS